MVMPGVTMRNLLVKERDCGAARRVGRLPDDQHRHHRRLAGAGRQFQRDPRQLGVRLLVRPLQVQADVLQVLLNAGAPLAQNFGDLRQPDHGLDRLHLTEERAMAEELVIRPAPVLQQLLRNRRHAPIFRIRQRPPSVNAPPDLVDDRRGVVLLLSSRNPLDAEHHRILGRLAAPPPRLWNRHNVRRPAPLVLDVVRRDAVLQPPVEARTLVRRVQNRLLEKLRAHSLVSFAFALAFYANACAATKRQGARFPPTRE